MGRRVRFVAFGTLLLLQAATIFALWSVSGQASADAVEQHLEALLLTAAEEAAIHTTEFIGPAEDTITVTAGLVGEAVIDAPNLEEAFLQQLLRNPQLAGLYVASMNGDFYFVSRTPGGIQTKVISHGDGGRRVEITSRDEQGRGPQTMIEPDDGYDPRTRPWFELAMAADGEISWTDPYVFFTSRRLGTTASVPVVVDGSVVGVVGADIELDALSEFLTTLRIGERGGAVITTSKGTVVAHPDPSQTRSLGPLGILEPTMLSDLPDETARLAAQVVRAGGSNAVAKVLPFEAAGGSFRAVGRNIATGDSTWSIVIHADESDFVGTIQQAQQRDRQLLLGIGVLALALGAGALFPATKPLERLALQAATDPLTQLDNRRTIMAKADIAARDNCDRCFVIIDLDRFKRVNDRHGHVIGDQVLEAVAGRLVRAIRPTDSVGRIGGEEFLMILNGATWEQAEPIVDRARNAIRSTPIHTAAGVLDLTASFGVAHATEASERAVLLSVADEALLQAKRLGRDRVRVVQVSDTPSRVTIDLTETTSVTRVAPADPDL